MKGKRFFLYLVTMMMLVGSVSAAKNFMVQDNGGNNLLFLDGANGYLNITTGKIAEEGVLLEDIYCKQGGCTMSGLLNLTTGTIDLAADAINEEDISFTTTCGAGNHLYVSGGNLACEANTVDTVWAIDGVSLINNSGTLEANETWVEAQAQDVIDANNLITLATASTHFVNRTDWTTIDDYPTGCTGNQVVQAIGDTLTCVDKTVDTKWTLDEKYINNVSNTATFNETLLNATIDARDTDTDTQWTIDDYSLINVTGTLTVNETYLNTTIDNKVSNDYVAKAGDTMTGDLIMNGADINLTGGAKIKGDGGTFLEIEADGDFVIRLDP